MVNTGRPSPACKACRAKRLKCDQTKPACIKCSKAKRVCPGYREPFEVNFRDQTLLTIRKHQRSNSNAKSIDSDQSRLDERPSSSSSEEDSPTTRPVIEFEPLTCHAFKPPPRSSLDFLSLQTSVEVQATCFFVSNFISVQTIHVEGGMSFLDPLVSSAQDGSAFHSTFMAASMASLASRPNASSLVPLARAYYNKALRQVSKVVQDREKSKEDESLAAIIMLILYEALMWEEQSRGSLGFHVQGAQAIVKLRGPEQRQHPVGYGMFEFIRAFMVHQCVHSTDYSSNNIKWWATEGCTEEPRHVLQRLIVEATLLRRQLGIFMAEKNGNPKSPTALKIYRKAVKLDSQMAEWLRSMDVVRQRTIDRYQDDVPEENIHHSTAYPGKVYTFKHILIASKFFNAHTHRLILAEIMAKISDWVQTHSDGPGATCQPGPAEREDAAALAREQVSELISMTPYFCSWPQAAAPSPYGGMTCSFQLYVTASSPFISPRQKSFLVGRLSHIAQMSGLKLAGKFAEQLVDRLRMRVQQDPLIKTEGLGGATSSVGSLEETALPTRRGGYSSCLGPSSGSSYLAGMTGLDGASVSNTSTDYVRA